VFSFLFTHLSSRWHLSCRVLARQTPVPVAIVQSRNAFRIGAYQPRFLRSVSLVVSLWGVRCLAGGHQSGYRECYCRRGHGRLSSASLDRDNLVQYCILSRDLYGNSAPRMRLFYVRYMMGLPILRYVRQPIDIYEYLPGSNIVCASWSSLGAVLSIEEALLLSVSSLCLSTVNL